MGAEAVPHAPSLETGFANARLIAAAPDLLAALEWAMDQIEYDLDLDHQEQVKAAYSAIARAKGEA